MTYDSSSSSFLFGVIFILVVVIGKVVRDINEQHDEIKDDLVSGKLPSE